MISKCRKFVELFRQLGARGAVAFLLKEPWFRALGKSGLRSTSFENDPCYGAVADAPAPTTAGSTKSVKGKASLTDRMLHGSLWVLVGRIGGMIATVILNVVLARTLQPADFGAFVLTVSIISFAVVAAMFGMNGAVLRLVSESLGMNDGARARQVLRRGLIISCVTAPCVTLATCFCIWLLVESTEIHLPAMIIGGTLMLMAWQQIAAEALRAMHEQRMANLFTGGQAGGPLTSYLFIGLFLAAITVYGPSLNLALGLNLLALACTLPIALAALWYTARHKFACESVDLHKPTASVSTRAILRLGASLTTIQLLVFITTQADIWIAGAQISEGDLALYAAARRLMMFVAIPMQLVNLTVAPTLAELYTAGRREELQGVLRGAAMTACLVTCAAVVGVAFAGQFVLSLVFGDWYRDAQGLLLVLCVGQVVAAWCGSSGYALVMTGKQNTELAITFVSSVLLAVLGPLAGLYFGPMGIAAAATFCVSVKTIAEWWALRYSMNLHGHPPFGLLLSKLFAGIKGTESTHRVTVTRTPSQECRSPRHPNFFIIGAPKAGTTALAGYLAEHPAIFMSRVKEPCFWSNDIPLPCGDRLLRYPRSLEEYLYLFQDASERHLAVGEASTSYLWSELAVERILAFNPEAKFICMLRNPVDLVYALHLTSVYFLEEPEQDFETAWRMRFERRKSPDPAVRIRLDYSLAGRLGTHVQRFFSLVPPDRRHVIVYDDFCADTRKCYQDVLDFIGVPDDNRSSFPVVNGARAHSIGALPKLIMQPPRWLVPVLCDLVRPTLRAVGIRQIRNTIIESMARSTRRVPLREEFRLELAAAFEEEVALLSELLERDLSHWLAAPRTSSSPTSGMSRSAPPCIVPL